MSRTPFLKDAYKQFTKDQDKILPPEETVRRFKEKLKALDLDILQDTKRIDTGRLGIPVYFSRCGKDATAVTGTKKQMGKGATPQQAEASAVMELAERFSFFSFFNQPENFIIDSYKNLSGRAIDFQQIVKSVHDTSDDPAVTRKVFENIPLKWVSAYNLTRQEETLIPFDWFYAINEFNGPSAGNCAEEAICQGICEIVERHVSSIVSRNKMTTPAIDPDSATDPMVMEMIQKYRTAGVVLHISDFTLDMGIPTVGLLAYDPSTFPEKSEIVWTAGTTPDPQKALSRALTEVAQLAGDFNTGSNYIASGLPKFRTIGEAEYVINAEKTVDITALPDISDNNIRVEIENCTAALAAKGLEIFVVDIMHPSLKIPAFYTIIPGTYFRERAIGTGVGLFSAKLIAEKNDPETAIGELKKIEKQLPEKYYIQFYLGSAYLDTNRPEKALRYYQRALDLEPKNVDIPSIYSYMGVCLKDMGEYRKAIDVLKEGLKLDAERTDIYNLMGFCHFKLKEHEEAIAAFNRVLRLDPSSAIDYANIGSNYREMGQPEKAIEYYEAALALDPSIDFALENLLRLRQKASLPCISPEIYRKKIHDPFIFEPESHL